ncbi:MAG: iron ABC transporter permease [Actinomycetia bacterium]|nr:iron ABC transporter permease [Actinomycetes bacterium]
MSAVPVTQLRLARRRRVRGHRLTTVGLVVLVAVLWVTSLMVGETMYGLGDVWRVVWGETVPGASFTVGELRLPRATLGLLAGLAYGAAGVTFQTLLRNQLASPDIIGISSGASAAGVIGIVLLGLSETIVSGFALASALLTAVVIYLLSYRGGFAGTRLILIGIGVSSMLGSVVSYVLSKANQWDLGTATRWLSGSLNGATWQRVAPLAVVCGLILPVMWFCSAQLGALRFGDETAVGLGVRVRSVRLWTIIAAVTLVAVATASCGPVAFVSFMSGPVAARLIRTAPSLVLPSSLVGAVLVLASDLAGQYLLGTRYPVGVITGALGAPFLVYLLIRTNRG